MKLTHGHNPIVHRAPPPTRLLCTASRVNLCTDRVKLADSLQLETLKTLEWPRVCTQLSPFASTTMGLSAAQRAAIPLGRCPEETKLLLEQTSAAVALSRPLDFEGIEDVARIVDVAVSGEMLSIGELCSVGRTLKAARSLAQQLEDVNESERCFPLLRILENCDFLAELERKIKFCIDCNFLVILDQASEELEIIRSERKRNIDNLEALLKQVSTNIFQAGGIERPLVTKRRSRMCVAVRTTHRSLLQGGVVLDSSGSGATYFMEPREAIELNNLEVRLKDSEKTEEQAILSYLSVEVAKVSEKLEFLLDRVLELDLAFARAGHARWINGARPVFGSNDFEVSVRSSLSVDVDALQHPLLLESSLRSGASTNTPVPVDFKIGDGVKVVVISGPNTGGKTASMKTLGLAALMLKAGMYLSARNHPKLPWFDHVFTDIGDHQSLEQNLSTFSGHISQICKIMEVASERSLVLLDEIGSGTDPSEGVALSTSILHHLKNRVNLAVVTTHYADLTRLKENDVRFENAAMEFSLEDLKPTYKILWGSTGQSNALSIAERIDFDATIVERAKIWVEKLTPEKMHKLNSLLYQSLTVEREKLKAQAETAGWLHSDVMELYHEIRNEADDLDVRESALKAQKTQEIRHELETAKMKMESVVKDFEKQLSITNPNEFKALLKKSEAEIASIVEAHQPFEDDTSTQKATADLHIPEIGERVLIKNLGNKLATVAESPSDDNTVLVLYGKITIRVHLSSIKSLPDRNGPVAPILVSKRQGQRKKTLKNLKILSETMKQGQDSYGPKVQTSKNTLDLRGKRVEEASMEMEMAINGRGPNSVIFIIHGMGTGVLKEHVLQLLTKHPRISKFEQESPLNYGCTVAYIK